MAASSPTASIPECVHTLAATVVSVPESEWNVAPPVGFVAVDGPVDKHDEIHVHVVETAEADDDSDRPSHPAKHEQHPNPSTSPPVTSRSTSAAIVALRGFGSWVLTPRGFLITLYGLNVVAWGGMLFLLLCNASPAMCWNRAGQDGHAAAWKDCAYIDSPRRVWIEIDSQILNALFCVTGLGLVPWRFRDLYLLLRHRCSSRRAPRLHGLRRLAAYHGAWYRLPGSETLDRLTPAQYEASLFPPPTAAAAINDAESGVDDLRLPLPTALAPPAPTTGSRAPATSPAWKLDLVVWSMCLNTFFQLALCTCMWGWDRRTRPAWSTGCFVALACGVAAAAGALSYREGRRVRRIEGGGGSKAVDPPV